MIPTKKEKTKQKTVSLENSAGKLDIILVVPPPWGVEAPPLGVACLSAYLRSRGLKAEIFDFNIRLYNKADSKHRYLWQMGSANYWRGEDVFNLLRQLFKDEIDYCAERIVRSGAAAAGLSVLSNSQDRITVEIIKRVKAKDSGISIILGGTSVSVPEQRMVLERELKDLVDAYVIGEGEETLCEALAAIQSGRALEEIPGVLIDRGGKYIYAPRTLKDNLSDFPFPTFEEFELGGYINRGKGLVMEWSRGCIGNCAFCAFKAASSEYRQKSPDSILRAIKYYVEKYGAEHFSLVDSAANGDLAYLDEICDLLSKSDRRVRFSCLAIPRKGMGRDLLEKMKKAGFTRIEYGVESGSDRVLRAMRKIYNSRDAESAIRETHDAGITTVIYLILGFPGEGAGELEETIKFLKRNAQYIDLVKSANPLYLMAGSPLYSEHKDYGITLPDVNPDFKWRIGSENTYETRLERVRRVRSVLSEAGIKYFSEDDMFEREIEIDKIGLKEEAARGKDVLLVTMPPWGVENPPIGLGYLDSYIRKKGLIPQVLDFNIYFYKTVNREYRMLWHVENKNFWSNEITFGLICELFKSQIEYAVDKILSSGTDLIGFSVVDPKERLTIEVIRRVKEKSPYKRIILGGPACSTQEQRRFFVDNIPGYIDYFVVGEGEETLYQIIQKERGLSVLGDLRGVAVAVNGKWRYTPRPLIKPIDSIPFPDYEGFELGQYDAGRSLLVEWSRGCVGRCSFCKNFSLMPGYRSRSPEAIIREISYIINRYGIKEFTVCDPLMNGDIRQLNTVCEGLVKNGFEMRWSGQIAPRKEMDYRLFSRMQKAGCSKIQIGVESGSDKVLRHMKKIYSSGIARDNIRLAKKAGMEVEVFIMVGFPGEGEREFAETYKFIKHNARYIDTIKSINTLHLIAGTDIYENYSRYNLKGLPQKNWHYLWETLDGNNYSVRKKRAQRLLDLSYSLGIRVMETNIQEGKEGALDTIKDKRTAEERLEALKESINILQALPQKRRVTRKPKSMLKWLILAFAYFYTFLYIVYFWLYMIFRNKALFGGRKMNG